MALERVAAFNHNASQWQRKPMIVSIENPDRSMLFSVPEIEAVMKKLGMRQVRYSCCAFGASYRKASVIWANGPWTRSAGGAKTYRSTRTQTH